jgi:hypothetical protein
MIAISSLDRVAGGAFPGIPVGPPFSTDLLVSEIALVCALLAVAMPLIIRMTDGSFGWIIGWSTGVVLAESMLFRQWIDVGATLVGWTALALTLCLLAGAWRAAAALRRRGRQVRAQ